MAKHRYSVGDKVMASRDESGENHEPGTVMDSYEIIIGDDHKPMVVVEFEDGERKYMTAVSPNVLPVEEEEEEPEAGEEAAADADAEQDDDELDEADVDEDEEDDEFFVDEEEGASP